VSGNNGKGGRNEARMSFDAFAALAQSGALGD
jgi:hypothetical protein